MGDNYSFSLEEMGHILQNASSLFFPMSNTSKMIALDSGLSVFSLITMHKLTIKIANIV